MRNPLGGLPRSLQAGVALMGLLGLLAWLAPLLATDLPWLVRDEAGMRAPALSVWLGGPRQVDDPATVLLRAPIPHDPNRVDLGRVLQAPSGLHWLGTDGLGRDLLARVLHGGRVSLGVGLLAAAFALLLGVPLGGLAGYRGGWTDTLVSRAIEAVLCFPTIVLILVLLTGGPRWLQDLPEVLRISLVLGLTGWVAVARYLRGEFMKVKSSDMVAAARSMGGGHLRITGRYILPCSAAPVLVTAAFTVASAIVMEAALSFIGLGVPPTVSTWGGLLNDARDTIERAWWLALFPGLALFLAILGCNLLGEGVRDWLDPRHRET